MCFYFGTAAVSLHPNPGQRGPAALGWGVPRDRARASVRVGAAGAPTFQICNGWDTVAHNCQIWKVGDTVAHKLPNLERLVAPWHRLANFGTMGRRVTHLPTLEKNVVT